MNAVDKLRLGFAVLALLLSGATAVRSNSPPPGTVASARPSFLGIPLPWNRAFLTESGDVVDPLLHMRIGHVNEDGTVDGMLLPKGKVVVDEETGGCDLYHNVLPVDGANLPWPTGKMAADGTVRTWPLGLAPSGRIEAEEGTSTQDQCGLALWLVEPKSSGSSSKSK